MRPILCLYVCNEKKMSVLDFLRPTIKFDMVLKNWLSEVSEGSSSVTSCKYN